MSERKHVKVENWYNVFAGERVGPPHKGPTAVVNGHTIDTHVDGKPRSIPITKAGWVDGYFIEADGSLTPSYVERPA